MNLIHSAHDHFHTVELRHALINPGTRPFEVMVRDRQYQVTAHFDAFATLAEAEAAFEQAITTHLVAGYTRQDTPRTEPKALTPSLASAHDDLSRALGTISQVLGQRPDDALERLQHRVYYALMAIKEMTP